MLRGEQVAECVDLCAFVSYPEEFARPPGLRGEIPFASSTATGTVAIYDDHAVVAFAKTGGRDIFEHIASWLSNLNCRPYDPDGSRWSHTYRGIVHHGFATGLDSVWHELSPVVAKVARDVPVVLTGYSRGAAMAQLASARFYDETGRIYPTCTFASPKVGNREFCSHHPGVLRVENGSDLVPFLAPGPAISATLRNIPLLNRLVPDDKTVYENTGSLWFIDWDGDLQRLANWEVALMRAARWATMAEVVFDFKDYFSEMRINDIPFFVDHVIKGYIAGLRQLDAL